MPRTRFLKDHVETEDVGLVNFSSTPVLHLRIVFVRELIPYSLLIYWSWREVLNREHSNPRVSLLGDLLSLPYVRSCTFVQVFSVLCTCLPSLEERKTQGVECGYRRPNKRYWSTITTFYEFRPIRTIQPSWLLPNDDVTPRWVPPRNFLSPLVLGPTVSKSCT